MKIYYIIRGQARNGPFSESEILDLLEQGRLSPDDLCSDPDGEIESRVGDLFETFSHPGSSGDRHAPQADDQTAKPGSPDRDHDDPDEMDEPGNTNPRNGTGSDGVEGGSLSPSGREVLARYAPSFISYLTPLVAGIGFAAAGQALSGQSGWFSFAGISLLSVIYAYVVFHRSSRDYIVTAKRIELITGLIAKSSKEVRISDIRAINVRKKGLLGLLGVGDVEFASAGSDGVDVAFTRVWRPHQIKRFVRRLQDG